MLCSKEFNRGVFDYLIATDSSLDTGEVDDDVADSDSGDSGGEESDDESGRRGKSGIAKKGGRGGLTSSSSKKGRGQTTQNSSKGADYGVSRGIDFQGVNFVLNFDFPTTPAAYTHRVGRTARGIATGTALSFVLPRLQTGSSGTAGGKALPEEHALAEVEHITLETVRQQQPRLGVVEGDNVLTAVSASGSVDALVMNGGGDDQRQMQPSLLQFNMAELDAFRYRVTDTLRSVTAAAVRELRSAELKREVMNSEKLKSYFADNPNDLKVRTHVSSSTTMLTLVGIYLLL
jgi:ATP-dependent RNA helicase DDX56/DBP9